MTTYRNTITGEIFTLEEIEEDYKNFTGTCEETTVVTTSKTGSKRSAGEAILRKLKTEVDHLLKMEGEQNETLESDC